MTERTKVKPRLLLLGGTGEASVLAARLASDGRFEAILSLAGRTARPNASPIPMRIGGFGGVEGLGAFLTAERIDVVVDATHPFAARISANAAAACRQTGIALIVIERPPWHALPGDAWRQFQNVEAAIAALPQDPARVFSGLGRLSLDALAAAPQHHYVIRVIDPLEAPLGVPNATVITARGPFETAHDVKLFQDYGIDIVLAKNSGGRAAVSKIEAARALGLELFMIDRPPPPATPAFETVDQAWHHLTSHYCRPAKRGV